MATHVWLWRAPWGRETNRDGLTAVAARPLGPRRERGRHAVGGARAFSRSSCQCFDRFALRLHARRVPWRWVWEGSYGKCLWSWAHQGKERERENFSCLFWVGIRCASKNIYIVDFTFIYRIRQRVNFHGREAYRCLSLVRRKIWILVL